MGDSGDDAGRRVTHPGPVLRALPSFSFSLPEGWRVRELPGALAVVEPSGSGDAGSQLTVSARRVPADADLRRIAPASLARLRREHPDLEVATERIGHFGDGGRPMYVRAIRLTVGDPARTISEVHALVLAPPDPQRPVQDLFVLVGRCADRDVDRHGPVFLGMVASFRFGDSPDDHGRDLA